VSANNNNKRVRRAIVELLLEHGPATREEVAELLQNYKGVKNVPSPNSLSALMSKNPQVVIVGKQKVEMTLGINTQHMLFDIDRQVIKTKDDLILTRPISVMTPSERRVAIQCQGCGRTRIMPKGSDLCITCVRRD
jgi:hypothetical protein|tara:strand:+ start:6668 stop:7075 length:408 start_codon:yes stop_codon:yes gene_type:complete